MNINKLCKIYVGIGMVYAGVLFAGVRKIDKNEWNKFSTEAKVSAFAKLVLTWPRYVYRLVKACATGVVDGYCNRKELKESTNESNT